MGSGHSGSTILDILLGNSARIESVGELLAGLKRAEREICSCGIEMADCPFWRGVRARVEAEGIAWDEACGISASGPGGLWRVWRAGRADPEIARRARLTQARGAGDRRDRRQAACARVRARRRRMASCCCATSRRRG